MQSVFVPITVGELSVFAVHDVAYADSSNAQKLDIYLPSGEGPFPLVMYVHGGAFKFGDKGINEATGAFSYLLDAGYALASINYRLSGESLFPAQIQDVKTAVRWLRANAILYHLDARRFGAWGASAGGHLVSLLGTSANVASLEGAELGHAEQSSQVQAVVAWYAPIDFLQMDTHLLQNNLCGPEYITHNNPDSPESELMGAPIQSIPEIVRTANPTTYVQSGMPPFLIEHGTDDCVVPAQQAQLLYDAMLPFTRTGYNELVYIPGATHADLLFEQAMNMRRVIEFFDRHLR